jgi:hypothetical protein
MSLVSVACKLPHGLVLDLEEKGKVVLKGALHSDAVGGYGITKVDKEFWEAWSKLYAEFPPFKAGHVFAQETEKNLRAEAEEKSDEKTGFERLDPTKPAQGVVAENYDGMPKA